MNFATRNFLTRPAPGIYQHAPVLSFNDRARYERALAPVKLAAAEAVRHMTQEDVMDRMRRRGWKLKDNLVHADHAKMAKVMVHEEERSIAVIYPDASVDRVNGGKLLVEYRSGWFSPSEKERQRLRTNAKMPVGERRIQRAVYLNKAWNRLVDLALKETK